MYYISLTQYASHDNNNNYNNYYYLSLGRKEKHLK